MLDFQHKTLAALLLIAGATPLAVFGQAPPSGGPGITLEVRKPPFDEFKALLGEVAEAYKAPREVDKDVLDELRKQYRDPKPDRELKILKEVRRLYVTTPQLEENIVREMRKAYEQPSTEQEDRVFLAIRQGGQLPLGTVSSDVLTERVPKIFGKIDQNRDGFLDREEMPEVLREQLGKWDANRDGAIDVSEYTVYFQAQLKLVGDGVASGEIPLKPAQAMGVRLAEDDQPGLPRPAPERPAAAAKAKLPDWFSKFDLDQDGQVGLYEWRKMGRPTAEFLEMDLNHDGFITADELATHLAKAGHGTSTGK